MLFAVPTALWLAAIALPIIALYILKVRLRRLPVSTNLFWKQIYDEKPPRSIWQQLRHWLSLLAQLLLLRLLVFVDRRSLFFLAGTAGSPYGDRARYVGQHASAGCDTESIRSGSRGGAPGARRAAKLAIKLRSSPPAVDRKW